MSSQSVQAVQINRELQGCAKHWVRCFWQEGVYNHQHLLFCLTRTFHTTMNFLLNISIINIYFPTLKVSCTFSIVSCNQLYCVQKKSFSHSSPRCIFLYSVHAGGDPSLFLPLASCAMSRNYVKMGRPTNQVQFMSRQLQFEINLLFLACSECSQCIDEKI